MTYLLITQLTPLHAQVRSHHIHCVKRHLLPIHHLLHHACLDPKQIKVALPVRKSPGYSPPFDISIPPSKDDVLTFSILTETEAPVRIYSDSSGFEGGIGAVAWLYLKDRLVKTLWCYLGTVKEHMVYEVEGVGLAMGLHLLKDLNIKLTHPMVLGSNSQAPIRVLNNQCSHPGNTSSIISSVHQRPAYKARCSY